MGRTQELIDYLQHRIDDLSAYIMHCKNRDSYPKCWHELHVQRDNLIEIRNILELKLNEEDDLK